MAGAYFWDIFVFSSFVRPGKNQQNDAETATCYLSLGENSPRDQAQIKERPTWRSIAGSRALYDQMAPQLCLFYISAKFDFRPTKQHLRIIRDNARKCQKIIDVLLFVNAFGG